MFFESIRSSDLEISKSMCDMLDFQQSLSKMEANPGGDPYDRHKLAMAPILVTRWLLRG